MGRRGDRHSVADGARAAPEVRRTTTETRPRKLPDSGLVARAGSATGGSRSCAHYLSSTEAPTSSSCALIDSASSLAAPSLTLPGAPSTRSFASLRPRPVTARTTLITWIFLSSAPVRTTSKESFSSSAAAPSPPPAAGAAATATGAAAVTPHSSSIAFLSSTSSSTVILPSESRTLFTSVAIPTPPLPASQVVRRSPTPRSRRLPLRRNPTVCRPQRQVLRLRRPRPSPPEAHPQRGPHPSLPLPPRRAPPVAESRRRRVPPRPLVRRQRLARRARRPPPAPRAA